MPAELLSEDTVRDRLSGSPWKLGAGEIVREATFADFKEAMSFVNRVADLAEARNHHPDIAVSWNRVTLRLSTHSAGGITAADLELAAAIDGIAG
ncbi:MAG TPA: 4a-hydroxytetrahydrobiopterin dehydratase [Acidimicrobiales bacterium]|nr:4a-hydroxytetrahydrobiopterin dehydratase [Acidimicrobiales bacterium]